MASNISVRSSASAYIVMAHIVMACIAMASNVSVRGSASAYIAMAHKVMAGIVMASNISAYAHQYSIGIRAEICMAAERSLGLHTVVFGRIFLDRQLISPSCCERWSIRLIITVVV